MKIIARKEQIRELERICASSSPEFTVVYGRRRIGKTYLIREFFNERFAFYSSGVLSQKSADQLKVFKRDLQSHGDDDLEPIKNWMDAFAHLKGLLEKESVYRDLASAKRIVFLDEVPWMAGYRSDFLIALDWFWNTYASMKQDMVLIVCGSSASWIIDHFLKDTGGFHNRVTSRIILNPFTLRESEEYLSERGVRLTRREVIETYMTFGGVPYYLNQIDPRASLSANIDRVCLDKNGMLHDECDYLFRSLFRNHGLHLEIIDALSTKKRGLSRQEILASISAKDGGTVSKALEELEQCHFIRSVLSPDGKKKSALFQLIDPFVLFAKRFIANGKISSWQRYRGSPSFYAWAGNAFEIVCFSHIASIKASLGIPAVESKEYAWRSEQNEGGAQIDLVLDRKDGIIHLCEIKFTLGEYVLSEKAMDELQHKADTFLKEFRTKSSVHLTLLSFQGVSRNSYCAGIQEILDGDSLFLA